MPSYDVPVRLPDGRVFDVPVDDVDSPESAVAAVEAAMADGSLTFPDAQTASEAPQGPIEEGPVGEDQESANAAPVETEEGSGGVPAPMLGGVTAGVMETSPAALIEIAPEGVDPAAWAQAPREERLHLLTQINSAQQDRLREQNPELAPTMGEDNKLVYGKAKPVRPQRGATIGFGSAQANDVSMGPAGEVDLRQRGVDTRSSAGPVSGSTVALLNIATPPPVDPEDEDSVNAFADWRGRMRLALSESLKRDNFKQNAQRAQQSIADDPMSGGNAVADIPPPQDIMVEYDETTGEWVYLNPTTQEWQLVQPYGINDEDLSALVQDPVQAGIVAAEIALAFGIGVATSGVGLIAAEAALGSSAAAASQVVRNRRAQELGFDMDLTENVGTAAALGGGFGAAGAAVANLASKAVARKAATGQSAMTAAQLETADKLLDRSARRELKEAMRAQEAVQKEIDETLEALATVRGAGAEADEAYRKIRLQTLSDRRDMLVASDAPPEQIEEVTQLMDEATADLRKIDEFREARAKDIPSVTATAGPGRRGSAALLEESMGKIRKAVEDALRRQDTGEPPLVVIRRAMKGLLDQEYTTLREGFDDATREMAKRPLPDEVSPPPSLADPEVIRSQALVDSMNLHGVHRGSSDAEILNALRQVIRVDPPGGTAQEVLNARELAVNTARDVIRERDEAVNRYAMEQSARRADYAHAKAEAERDADAIVAAREEVQKYRSAKDKVKRIKSQKDLINPSSPNALTAKQFADALLDPANADLKPKEQRIINQLIDDIYSTRVTEETFRRKYGIQLDSAFDLARVRTGIAWEISDRIRTGMKQSPEAAIGELSKIVENPRVMSLLSKAYDDDYVKALEVLRRGLRKHALPAGKSVEPVRVRKTERAPIRKTLRTVTDAVGVAGVVTSLLAGSLTPLTLVTSPILGRMVFRVGQRVDNVAGSEALSRLFSRPDLVSTIGKMRTRRGGIAAAAPVLREMGIELSVLLGEPVQAVQLEDGTVVPLTGKDGKPLTSLEEVRARTKEVVADIEKKLE